jgi:hypothetical protein
MTIITPCSRPENLQKLKESINFDKIHKWIICYDTSNGRKYPSIFSHKKILEIEANGESQKSIVGHFQYNAALDLVEDDYVYRLDDDNIMHPDFWKKEFTLTDDIASLVYTFPSCRRTGELYVDAKIPKVGFIDSACFCTHTRLIQKDRWQVDKYEADGLFIETMVNKTQGKFNYTSNYLAYYNYLR